MKKQTKRARLPEARKSAAAVRKETPSVAAQAAHGASRPFPIVGIGASAGGLEALELFLKNVPANSGMAFVIVQHMDPTRKGMMPELLQRATAMKVVQVRDRTKVQPDHVYVIPPNKDMSILRGILHLLEPTAPRGLRLPIDLFLGSLADDQQGRSIGVILSGMGADGTLGLQAIKSKGGVAFVQEPASAKIRRHAAQRHRRRAGGCHRPGRGVARHDTRLSPAHPCPSPAPHSPQRTRPKAASRRSSSCCERRRATTSPSTRRTPCIAGSSGAWASTR